jgi:predicted dehydrogenase
MNTIRYGIIGFGGIALNRIAREGFGLDTTRFERTPGVELVGATSPSGRLRSEAEALGVPWYESVDALLSVDELDAVFVASPNSLHADHARAAFKAGKHCIVEKPITVDLDSAIALRRLARDTGLSLAVNHMMIHNVWNGAARAALRAGTLGEVNDLVLHMEFLYGASPEEAASWRCAKPEERGGPIGDVGSHCLYMAEFLLGEEIVAIRATEEPRVLEIAVENGATISFQTVSGRRGTVRASFSAPRGGAVGTILNLGYEAYGSDGVLRAYGTLFQLSGHPDEPFAQRIEIESSSGRRDLSPDAPVRNIYRAVIEDHAASIRDGRPGDGTDALHNLRLVLAAYESMERAGAPVKIFSE